MVLQDLPVVIEDARATGLPGYIETNSASFFEPQQTQGEQLLIKVSRVHLGSFSFLSQIKR